MARLQPTKILNDIFIEKQMKQNPKKMNEN